MNKRKGICTLDVTGPVIFGKLFCEFFKINHIKDGLNEYKGLDKKTYNIYFPFKQIDDDYLSYINDNSKLIVQNKNKNHFKNIYKNEKLRHYDYQWKNNQIFKN